MNVGHGRYSESVVYLLQYLQRLFVTDTHKGIQTRTVGFTVRPFEYYGICSFSVMVTIRSAMRIAISSPSMTHGPASRKKFPAGLFFNSIIGCY